jgi:hypothetical protein
VTRILRNCAGAPLLHPGWVREQPPVNVHLSGAGASASARLKADSVKLGGKVRRQGNSCRSSTSPTFQPILLGGGVKPPCRNMPGFAAASVSPTGPVVTSRKATMKRLTKLLHAPAVTRRIHCCSVIVPSGRARSRNDPPFLRHERIWAREIPTEGGFRRGSVVETRRSLGSGRVVLVNEASLVTRDNARSTIRRRSLTIRMAKYRREDFEDS